MVIMNESNSFHRTLQRILKDLELSIFELLLGLNQSFAEHIHIRNYLKKRVFLEIRK